MTYKLSKSSLKNREGVDPRLIAISDLALTISRYDFGHGESSGLRTAEEQHQIFLDGYSRADGYNRKSYHQTGLALDFYAFVDGKASWDKEHLAVVAAAFLQAAAQLGVPLRWGGQWKSFQDYPHLEIRDGI